jgi:hypothetical protein
MGENSVNANDLLSGELELARNQVEMGKKTSSVL